MTQSMAIQRRDLITGSKSQKNTTHMPLKEGKEQLCSARTNGIQSAHLLQSFMDVGAYTSSSNRDTDEATDAKHCRPQGQKAAKERRKGKGKGKLGKGRLSDESVGQFNNMQIKKSEAIEKMAADAREHAQAIAIQAEADKEKVKMEKIKQFNELLKIDTSSYSESQKARHEKTLDFLSNEIYGVEK
uniref:No apical meristem-associated C-terminal domain-containing protein n=1 Tax=Oryza glaberrima TaxID=4538 RepID=I1PNX0_ORYGL